MKYKLSPLGKERLAKIAERNNLPVFTALEVLLLIADLGKWVLDAGIEQPQDPDLEQRRQTTLGQLLISTRLFNALSAASYASASAVNKGSQVTVAELAAIPLAEYMRVRGMGKKSLKEWSEHLASFGYPPLPV